MSLYTELGVSTFINAAGHYTTLGGSVTSPRVANSMVAALQEYAEISELQSAVHGRLATLTGAPAAYVTTGAAAGLYLLTLAAVRRRGTRHREERDRVVAVMGEYNNPFLEAIEQAGGRLRRVDQVGGLTDLSPADVLFAVFTPSRRVPLQELPQAIGATRSTGVRLVVDAAAQIPPYSNLRAIPAAGSAATIFSGGKAIRGPQATGLILGDTDFVAPLGDWAFPKLGQGRLLKVGRESLIGLLVAVEEALARDDEAILGWFENQVRMLTSMLSEHPVLLVERGFPNVAGQPIPLAVVRARHGALDTTSLAQFLREGKPSIRLGDLPSGEDMPAEGLIVNPLTLGEGDTKAIVRRLLEWRPSEA